MANYPSISMSNASTENCLGQVCPGDVIQLNTSRIAGLYRVVHVSKPFQAAYLFCLLPAKDLNTSVLWTEARQWRRCIKASQPVAISLHFLTGLNDAQISKVPSEPQLSQSKSRISMSEIQLSKLRTISERTGITWSTLINESAFELNQFWRVISDAADAFKIHRTTLARDLSRFFVFGMDAHASALASVVGRGQSLRSIGGDRKVTKKLGRPHRRNLTGHTNDPVGVNLTAEVQNSISIFLRTCKDRNGRTVASLFREFQVLQRTRVEAYSPGQPRFQVANRQYAISYGQFKYHAEKLESVKDRVIKRVGRKTYSLKLRALLGTAQDRIGFPGHTYLIDATVIDVNCVSAIDRRLLIGRPVVYAVIDAWSQVILSIHVALEGPNMKEAKVALYEAMTDKSDLLNHLKSSQLTEGFVQGVKPLFLFSDRGELLSESGRKMAEDLGIAQSIAAPYRADWKSIVERYFGVQNSDQVHWMPGAVRKRMRERGDRDTRNDAALTVNELKRLLLSSAATWNMTHDMSQHVSCTMLRQEINATPIDFWKYGLKALHGSPFFVHPDQAIKTLLPVVEARIDRQGVHLFKENLRYTGTWMRDEPDFFESISQRSSAYVYVNPTASNEVFFENPLTAEIKRCQLVDSRDYRDDDVSLEDIRMVESYVDLTNDESLEGRKLIAVKHAVQRDALIRQAKRSSAEARSIDTRSTTQRLRNIRTNRAAEAAHMNFQTPAEPASDPGAVDFDPVERWRRVFHK